MLSDGNWTPTCCSLGSLLMNRRERGQRRRDGKDGRRKLSCVMYRHRAKASISFTKPLSMSRLNNLPLLSPGEKGLLLLAHFHPLRFLLHVRLLLFLCYFSLLGFPLPFYFPKMLTFLCSIPMDVPRPICQTNVVLGLPH